MSEQVNRGVASNSTFRIFLVDDQPMMAWAVRQLLVGVADMEFAGAAAGVEAALEALAAAPTDVVIIGMDYDDGTGFGLIKDLRIRCPRARIIIFSALSGAAYAEHCLRLGARGYVCKSEPTDQLLHCIRQVMAGNVYLNGERYSAILSRIVAGGRHVDSLLEHRLSNGEFEVFHLIGRGLTNQDIAQRLHRSAKTVETYRTRIKEKLGIASGMELAQFAFRYCTASNAAVPAATRSPVIVQPSGAMQSELAMQFPPAMQSPAAAMPTGETPGERSPIPATDQCESEPETSAAPPARQAHSACRALDVLVVDDHEVIRKPLCVLLQKSGMHPRSAADGIEALKLIQQKIPDVILLDVAMPRMDGVQVLAALNEDARRSAIPVIVMTGFLEGELLEQVRAFGVPVILKTRTEVSELTVLIRRLAAGDASLPQLASA